MVFLVAMRSHSSAFQRMRGSSERQRGWQGVGHARRRSSRSARKFPRGGGVIRRRIIDLQLGILASTLFASMWICRMTVMSR
jgi:hypothetical protein